LNDKARGCIIIIMQRLHQDDLVGHVLEQEGWEILSFPAIAEVDEAHLIESPLGSRRFGARPGKRSILRGNRWSPCPPSGQPSGSTTSPANTSRTQRLSAGPW
jgi:hypothetical protein